MLDYHPRAGEDAIEPFLLVPDKPGRPRKYSLREILNAIFYVLRRCKLIKWKLSRLSGLNTIVPVLAMKGSGIQVQFLPLLIGDFDSRWISAFIQYCLDSKGLLLLLCFQRYCRGADNRAAHPPRLYSR